MKILGLDEAGRGPVIGPLAVAGVMMKQGELGKLKKLGVKDSKLLAKERREALYEKIIAVADGHDIVIVTAAQIDSALRSPTLNLNWLEAQGFAEIINRLRPDKAYIDCPSTNIARYSAYLKNLLERDVELVLEHKADLSYPIVSAASILAKVARDREIESLRKRYGDFGSGYCSDPKTQEFLKRSPELPIYRRTWCSWRRLEDEKSQTRLDGF